MIACAAEEGLFSVFAQYDRELYDRYGLLFVNAGQGTGELRLGWLLDEADEYASYILEPGRGRVLSSLLTGGTDLLALRQERDRSAVTGYVLATDQEGAAFKRQVCEQVKAGVGGTVLQSLKDRLSAQSGEAAGIKNRRNFIREDLAEQYHAEDEARRSPQVQEEARALRETAEEAAEGEQESPEDGTEGGIEAAPAPAERIRNPITIIAELKEQGILALAVPDASQISAGEISSGDALRGRTQNTGMNMAPTGPEGAEVSLCLTEYLCSSFPCYTGRTPPGGLIYQIEYAVSGKLTDRENLEAVLTRILVIREAANMVFLMSSPVHRAEADAMALKLSAALMQPALEPVISFGLKAAWAFGESVVDCRTLLSGGRIPITKTEESWQLDLDSLADLMEVADSRKKSSESGLTYLDYLRLLLAAGSQKELTDAAMDLTEWGMRKTDPTFRLDCCLDVLEIEQTVRAGSMTYTVCRSWGYDMK